MEQGTANNSLYLIYEPSSKKDSLVVVHVVAPVSRPTLATPVWDMLMLRLRKRRARLLFGGHVFNRKPSASTKTRPGYHKTSSAHRGAAPRDLYQLHKPRAFLRFQSQTSLLHSRNPNPQPLQPLTGSLPNCNQGEASVRQWMSALPPYIQSSSNTRSQGSRTMLFKVFKAQELHNVRSLG